MCEAMRSTPLAPDAVLLALERFAPQSRPYNFDDMFDCWGFQRRLFDWLDDGDELNAELGDAEGGGSTVARRSRTRDELLPGDIVVSHPHPDAEFHTVIYAAAWRATDLVYDTSSRARVPLFDDGRLVAERQIFTRFMSATETTDRLRHDGGAYLRLCDDRVRFLHEGLHARLAAANPEGERDLVVLRRAAGLSDLPFYCRRRLATDARGREVYDNRETRGARLLHTGRRLAARRHLRGAGLGRRAGGAGRSTARTAGAPCHRRPAAPRPRRGRMDGGLAARR